MANILKQIKVGDTTYNIEPVTSYYKVGCSNFEMNDSGSLKGYGGFIDFHFFNSSGQPLNSSGSVVSSTPDYTSRIIEDSAGCLDINGTYIAWTGLTSGYIKSNGSIDATTFNENGTSLANKYAAKSHTHDDRYYTESEVNTKLDGKSNTNHTHDGRYLRWAGSAANADAMGWGTLTANNGYTILSHASSSDGGDWGMTYQGGKIYMQLDGYYYQNEGQYRVLDTSDSSSFAAADHTHSSVTDIGNSTATTFAYSKSGLNYGDYTWLAGWNGYELRAVNKSQFATAGHTHDDRYYTESEINTKLNGKSDTSHTHNYLPVNQYGGVSLSNTLDLSSVANAIKFSSASYYVTNIEAGSIAVNIGTASAGYTTSISKTFHDYKKGNGSWYVVATVAGDSPAQPEVVIAGISTVGPSGINIRVRKIANNSSGGSPTWRINYIAIKYY